ncbi:hypothetical protein Pelo_7189 [Pelomyxa schiedti]|nr:hypothetical protein Pelo_7189 [Pelomyxa schiedti]
MSRRRNSRTISKTNPKEVHIPVDPEPVNPRCFHCTHPVQVEKRKIHKLPGEPTGKYSWYAECRCSGHCRNPCLGCDDCVDLGYCACKKQNRDQQTCSICGKGFCSNCPKCTCICSDETKEESHSAWPWKKFTTLSQKWQKKLNEEDTEEIFNASASSDPRQRDLAMHHMLLRQQFSGTTTSQSTMTSVRNARQGGCDSGGRRRDPQQEETQQEDDTSDGNPDPELDLPDQDEDDQDSGLNQGTDAREPPMKKARAQMLDALKKFILYTTPLCESTDTTKAVLSFLVSVMQAYEGTVFYQQQSNDMMIHRLLEAASTFRQTTGGDLFHRIDTSFPSPLSKTDLPPSTPGVAMSMESGVATISKSGLTATALGNNLAVTTGIKAIGNGSSTEVTNGLTNQLPFNQNSASSVHINQNLTNTYTPATNTSAHGTSTSTPKTMAPAPVTNTSASVTNTFAPVTNTFAPVVNTSTPGIPVTNTSMPTTPGSNIVHFVATATATAAA